MRVRTLQDLRALVLSRRSGLGWTQAELAARSQVSRRWVVMFEAGHAAAEVGKVLAVLNALGIELTAAWEGDPGPRPEEREPVDVRAVLREYLEGEDL